MEGVNCSSQKFLGCPKEIVAVRIKAKVKTNFTCFIIILSTSDRGINYKVKLMSTRRTLMLIDARAEHLVTRRIMVWM